jgi:hypothetical protein
VLLACAPTVFANDSINLLELCANMTLHFLQWGRWKSLSAEVRESVVYWYSI